MSRTKKQQRDSRRLHRHLRREPLKKIFYEKIKCWQQAQHNADKTT